MKIVMQKNADENDYPYLQMFYMSGRRLKITGACKVKSRNSKTKC